jgi:hypothetical protein
LHQSYDAHADNTLEHSKMLSHNQGLQISALIASGFDQHISVKIVTPAQAKGPGQILGQAKGPGQIIGQAKGPGQIIGQAKGPGQIIGQAKVWRGQRSWNKR